MDRFGHDRVRLGHDRVRVGHDMGHGRVWKGLDIRSGSSKL